MHYIADQLRAKGAKAVIWDLGEKPLPIAVPEYHKSQEKHPSKRVREFVKLVSESDGYILGSPLYHDSYSGVLKNALDSLPNEAFYHKPVGLVSHSSNVRSCITPCNQLRPVVRSLAGYATQIQVGTTDADYKIAGNSLKLVDQRVIDRVVGMVDELMLMTQIVNSIAWTEYVDFSKHLKLNVSK